MSEFDQAVVLGETLVLELQIFADEAQTEPVNLTSYTVSVILSSFNLGENPPVILTVGEGFTYTNRALGQLKVVYALEASAFAVGLGEWAVELIDPEGHKTFPLGAKLIVGRTP